MKKEQELERKQDILNYLKQLYENNTPEFIYYKTRFHSLGTRRAFSPRTRAASPATNRPTMKASLQTILTLAACLAAVSLAPAEDAKTYKITLHRPPTVGTKTRDVFQVKTARAQRLTSDGKVLKETKEELQAELAGVTEPLEVSPHGKIQKVKFTVEKFSVQMDAGAAQEALQAGAVISGALDEKGKPSFTANAGEISPEALKVLMIVFELTPDRPNDPNDDVVFATNQPRTVGSEWEVNKAEMIKSMPADIPFKLTENQISGRVKFPSVKQTAGQDECAVQAEVTMKPTEMTGMPPGFQLAGINLVIGVNGLIPVDEKTVMPFGKASFRMNINGHMDTPNGKVVMEMSESRDKEYKSQLVK